MARRIVEFLPWVTTVMVGVPSVWLFFVTPIISDLDEWGKGLGEALYFGIPLYLSWILPAGYGVGWLLRRYFRARLASEQEQLDAGRQ